MKLSRSWISWLVLFGSLLSMRLAAQVPQQLQEMNQVIQDANDLRQIQTYESAPNTAVIIVHAFADEKPVSLDRSVRVDLTNMANHLGVFQTVQGHQTAVFVNTSLGRYDVSVTAVGYLSTHQEISVLNPAKQDVEIVLRRDPAAITLNEASGPMSTKGKKEAKRALSLLKNADLSGAEKHLKAAYALAPSNADLNFLLGYLYFQKNDYEQAGTYLDRAASLGAHSAQTLTLLGRTRLQQHNYPAAQSALEQATLVDSEDWLPHNLLANTYLQEKAYGKTRDEAQIAVAKSVRYGKNASGAAQLTLGQALLGLGQMKEGIQALQTFLKNSPPENMVAPVRALIARAEQSDQASAAASQMSTPQVDPLMAVPKLVLSMQTWRPPDIDDVKPNLEPAVSCPTAQVLAGAGLRAQELVQNVARFSAKEVLFHKSLDNIGLSSNAEIRKYDYVAAISSQRGFFQIDEYRTNVAPQNGYPDGIASSGFIMLALVFHPQMQRDFDFDCEGQGQWHGQPSWLMHFRQRHDRPSRMQSYYFDRKTYLVDLKGRAWISPDSFQILHMEADMANPIHDLQLLSEHQIVEYAPVPFAKTNTMLWLPTKAEIYLDFRKHRYYRRHSFDQYMLFDVGTSQQDKNPPATSTSGPASTTGTELPN
jgi:tetratricopeptide (TPR) repeat protein